MDRNAEFFVPSDEARRSSMVIGVLLCFDPKVIFTAYIVIMWETVVLKLMEYGWKGCQSILNDRSREARILWFERKDAYVQYLIRYETSFAHEQ